MELLITLGHNASVIGMKDGKIIAGYEEERLTGIKSCSLFAENSIKKIFELCEPNSDEENTIYISHWFDDYDFHIKYNERINKYFKYDIVNELKEKYNFYIVTLNDGFTHHDAHAWSAISFYLAHNGETCNGEEKTHIIVADGFGNKQEVMSIYEGDFTGDSRSLFKNHVASGYTKSLGLMYQYATSFCGMKENQDEYKFLGYESDIDNVCIDEDIKKIDRFAIDTAEQMANAITGQMDEDDGNPAEEFINLDELKNTKDMWWEDFQEIIDMTDVLVKPDVQRIVIGYYIQKIIEEVHIHIIKKYNIKNVILTGGIYYNVKLNNRIMNEISGNICICPVCGDQGAAIGLYQFYEKNFPFGNLIWGKRDEITAITVANANFTKVMGNQDEMVDAVVELLEKNKIVNIMHGDMEFGPRALCHTTTLALPYKSNVQYINHLNKRNTVMPMAPCMLDKNVDEFFVVDQYDRVIGSDQYMILTYDYKIDYCDEYSGIMHKYPCQEKYSGRPQIVVDKKSTIYKILEKIQHKTKALINTSFNIHGKPIVFTVDQAMEDFLFQFGRANEDVYLFIGAYSE